MLELITAGVELMLVGMTIVFVFLVMLIGAVNVMSTIVQRFFPEPREVLLPIVKSTDESVTIAAISAAVHQYRSKYK
jgi:oxaloacetate decarboxylase (Na+ extruding) subunit gamma